MHYGRASLTGVTELPVIYVFPRLDVDVTSVSSQLATELQQRVQSAGKQAVVLFIDQVYQHAQQQLVDLIQTHLQVCVDVCGPVSLQGG